METKSPSNLPKLLQSFLSFFKQVLIAHWRSLLTLLVGVYVPLQIFELLAVEIWQNQGAFPWDERILLAVHGTASTQLDVFAATLTKLGSFSIAFPIAILLSLRLLLQRRWRSLIYLITALLGSAIINNAAKTFLHRVRPHLWESFYPLPHSYAFPSGHAMTSMTIAVALIVLTWNSFWCLPIAIVGSLYAIAIAWTRLYLGVHFPSDILAGWMVSLAWTVGIAFLIKPHLTKAIAENNQSAKEDLLLPEETATSN